MSKLNRINDTIEAVVQAIDELSQISLTCNELYDCVECDKPMSIDAIHAAMNRAQSIRELAASIYNNFNSLLP